MAVQRAILWKQYAIKKRQIIKIAGTHNSCHATSARPPRYDSWNHAPDVQRKHKYKTTKYFVINALHNYERCYSIMSLFI
jgi:hypothetical protein